ERDSLGVVYTLDQYRPTSRERDRVDNNSVKLTWVDKVLDWLTFRANYTFRKQSGSPYDTEVYGYTYFSGLPGFTQAYPNFFAGPETVDQLRKYDIADLTENKIDLMSTIAPRDDLTITASFRGDWNNYATLIGRQGYNTFAAQISTEWMPTPTDSVSAYIGYDHSALSIASVAGGAVNVPACGNLGSACYPLANSWGESDNERNYSAGATVLHRLNRATFDLTWSYIYSRGLVNYSAASAGALVFPSDFATIGSGFPANTYRVNSVTVGATMQLAERVSMRVFDSYEIGRIADWHYAGFTQGLVVGGNNLYTDGGPQSYTQNLVGVFVTVKL
ncbi:MAG TPA: MtrB/PioB family outer membrane beta-barrel protein, partial [Steroidobacteraceae bacterium]